MSPVPDQDFQGRNIAVTRSLSNEAAPLQRRHRSRKTNFQRKLRYGDHTSIDNVNRIPSGYHSKESYYRYLRGEDGLVLAVFDRICGHLHRARRHGVLKRSSWTDTVGQNVFVPCYDATWA